MSKLLLILGLVSTLVFVIASPRRTSSKAEVLPLENKTLTAESVHELNQRPFQIHPEVMILAGEWSRRLPPAGYVNTPVPFVEFAPGQSMAIAMIAEGVNRDDRLRQCRLDVRLVTEDGIVAFRGLKPSTVRGLKPRGSAEIVDQVIRTDVEVAELPMVKTGLSVVSAAIFDMDWAAPEETSIQVIRVEASLSSETSFQAILEPVEIKVRPWSSWHEEGTLDHYEEQSPLWGFNQAPKPGYLLPLLKTFVQVGSFYDPFFRGFMSEAYRHYPEARQAALDEFHSLTPKEQIALVLYLRDGGMDVSEWLTYLPEEYQAEIKTLEVEVPRIQAHFEESVPYEQVLLAEVRMLRCAGAWSAAGDVSDARAVVQNLAWREEQFTVQFTHQVDHLSRVDLPYDGSSARAVIYDATRTMTFEFRMTDPLFADWMGQWEREETFSPVIQSELANLRTLKF